MLVSRRHQSTVVDRSCSLPPTLLSTNYASYPKRPYLSDLRPFSDVYTLKNVSFQLVKAALLPTQLILDDFSKHENEMLELDEEEQTEFNWNASVTSRMQMFFPLARKFLSVSVIKSCLEQLSLKCFPTKVVDRMTKDLSKSIVRKCGKFSRSIACQKIMYTALWSCIPFNASLLLYEILEHLYHQIRGAVCATDLSACRAITAVASNTTTYAAKKVVYYSVCIGSSAVGFGLGSYANVKYGGGVCSMLFELVAGTGIAIAIGL